MCIEKYLSFIEIFRKRLLRDGHNLFNHYHARSCAHRMSLDITEVAVDITESIALRYDPAIPYRLYPQVFNGIPSFDGTEPRQASP